MSFHYDTPKLYSSFTFFQKDSSKLISIFFIINLFTLMNLMFFQFFLDEISSSIFTHPFSTNHSTTGIYVLSFPAVEYNYKKQNIWSIQTHKMYLYSSLSTYIQL